MAAHGPQHGAAVKPIEVEVHGHALIGVNNGVGPGGIGTVLPCRTEQSFPHHACRSMHS